MRADQILGLQKTDEMNISSVGSGISYVRPASPEKQKKGEQAIAKIEMAMNQITALSDSIKKDLKKRSYRQLAQKITELKRSIKDI